MIVASWIAACELQAPLDPPRPVEIQIVPEDHRGTYPVRGRTVAELRASLTEMADVVQVSGEGDDFHGITRWSLSWSPRTAPSGGGCRLEALTIRSRVVTLTPTWDRSSSNADLVARWDQYSEALERHEDGHRELVSTAAANLAGTVSELPPGPTCDALAETIDALGRSELERLKQAQTAYDEETAHGATQGARF